VKLRAVAARAGAPVKAYTAYELSMLVKLAFGLVGPLQAIATSASAATTTRDKRVGSMIGC
jgi:hypothetical protein